jgi:tRNA (guanine37-N1)-methyltransferase
MRFTVLTLFPDMIAGFVRESIIARAALAGLISVDVRNIRDYALDKHSVVDDYPYGGGAGMVMKADVALRAIESVEAGCGLRPYRILMTPQGRTFSQGIAAELACKSDILLFCGHYEGVDDRVSSYMDDELSIGDYVLTGGELAAAVVLDATARLVPGVLSEGSPVMESHAGSLLEGPQFTRPKEFQGVEVPAVLLSGDHEKVRRWRRKQSLRRTLMMRPDLLARAGLTREDLALLKEIWEEA